MKFIDQSFMLSSGVGTTVSQVVRLAAEHIENILPRPGPYHPAFAALIELADKLKAEEKFQPASVVDLCTSSFKTKHEIAVSGDGYNSVEMEISDAEIEFIQRLAAELDKAAGSLQYAPRIAIETMP